MLKVRKPNINGHDQPTNIGTYLNTDTNRYIPDYFSPPLSILLRFIFSFELQQKVPNTYLIKAGRENPEKVL